MTDAVRNSALYGSGLLLGAANSIRHRLQGYVNPRPFGPDDFKATVDHALEVVDRLEEHGQVRWAGQRVLEIGPGYDLTSGAVVIHRGAQSYEAVDLFDNQTEPAGLYDYFNSRIGGEVDSSRLRFTRAAFPHLPEVREEYDLIISNACLEHVDQVGPLLRRLRSVSAAGAKMVHHVDGKAHMRGFRDRDPLNILRYGEGIYNALLTFPGAPNRLRSKDFLTLAEEAGWVDVEVVPFTRATPTYLARTRVSRRFRDYEDLDVLTFTLVARAA